MELVSCHRVVVVALISAALSFVPVTSLAVQQVILREGKSAYMLGRHLEILEDGEKRWTLEEVSAGEPSSRFEPSLSDVPNFGFTSSAYWFRIEILSRLAEREDLYLEIAYPLLSRVDCYRRGADGKFTRVKEGDSAQGDHKAFSHHHFIYPIAFDPGEAKQIFFRVETQGALQFPLNLWMPAAFLSGKHSIQLGQGIYYGLLFVMLIYNFFLFLSIKDRSYLFFVLFILGTVIFQSSLDGLGQEYLWPDAPWLSSRVLILSLYAASLFALLLVNDFLALRRDFPAWGKTVSLGAAGIGGLLVLSFFMPYHQIIVPTTLIVQIGCVLLILCSFLSWRKGFRPAVYFLAGWGALFVGVFLLTLNKLGVLPRLFLTESAHQFGFALTILLLSFGLADRINIIRQEKERTQGMLRRAYEHLAEHDRLKSHFFSNVSHEVRTPLTMILAPLARFLAEDNGALPAIVRGQFRKMESNAQRLLQLVNQLLDFSRLEAGKTTVSFELLDVRDLVAPIVQAYAPFARSKGLKLDLRGSDRLPQVWADREKLDKVTCNLLSNALKFTEAGGTVVVRLASDETAVTISIMDTGIGISEQTLAGIFERFRQADSSTAQQIEGTGVSLALCKELLDLTGATIEVDSEKHVGTTFTVILPRGQDHIQDPSLIRHQDDVEAAPVRARAAAMALEVGDGGQKPEPEGEPVEMDASDEAAVREMSKPLLLVVEENEDIRAVIAEICRDEFEVIEEADGQKAIDLIEQRRPSLVICDDLSPIIDGNELLRRIRLNPETSSIPVILLASKSDQRMRMEGLERGADDYLIKPFEARELLARARNLVRLQQQERHMRQVNAQLQQEVMTQMAAIERVGLLGRFLPMPMVRSVIEGSQSVNAQQKRHRLTVFRLELRGFDELIDSLEPEDMVPMLNGYLSETMDVAFAHGATVDKFVRDTVMGFFGAPTSLGIEQDAIRCVHMAMEMLHRAQDVCARWQGFIADSPPSPTIVLASGYATVGSFGSSNRLEYTAVGGPVEEADLLLPRVEPGEVMCGQSTWQLIQDEIEGELYSEVAVGHRGRPLSLYRLKSAAITVS